MTTRSPTRGHHGTVGARRWRDRSDGLRLGVHGRRGMRRGGSGSLHRRQEGGGVGLGTVDSIPLVGEYPMASTMGRHIRRPEPSRGNSSSQPWGARGMPDFSEQFTCLAGKWSVAAMHDEYVRQLMARAKKGTHPAAGGPGDRSSHFRGPSGPHPLPSAGRGSRAGGPAYESLISDCLIHPEDPENSTLAVQVLTGHRRMGARHSGPTSSAPTRNTRLVPQAQHLKRRPTDPVGAAGVAGDALRRASPAASAAFRRPAHDRNRSCAARTTANTWLATCLLLRWLCV